MLGRRTYWDMRDMRRYVGYAEICGICGDMWDMRRYVGYAGRTTSPKSARPGCRFLDQPPPIHEERETGTANDLRVEKRMLILYLTC